VAPAIGSQRTLKGGALEVGIIAPKYSGSQGGNVKEEDGNEKDKGQEYGTLCDKSLPAHAQS
jgi:hypothetical protein